MDGLSDLKKQRVAVAAALLLLSAAACGPKAAPPKQYPITGQILAVLPERQSLTIRHEAIVGAYSGAIRSSFIGAGADLHVALNQWRQWKIDTA